MLSNAYVTIDVSRELRCVRVSFIFTGIHALGSRLNVAKGYWRARGCSLIRSHQMVMLEPYNTCRPPIYIVIFGIY